MEKFGKFQLLESIGKGGMAEIFLARPSDAALSKLVALKRILPELSAKPGYREMFRREGEIALRFRHPAIVTVNEVGKVNDVYYMSMEFLPGKTLAQLILKLREHKNALEIQDKVYIVKLIAEALQYIHDFSDHGELTEIIHRDISPQNILVGYDGAAKLIDFGVAKVNNQEEGTSSKDLKGKVAYMSPEQVRGDTLTKQTDIFSLGIVLWEVLAGRKLFSGETVKDVSELVEKCEIPMVTQYAPDVPVQLMRICYDALAKNVRDRYKNAGQFAADLDDVLRKFSRDRNEKRIAKAMQAMFPDDISRLQAVLKKHELVKRSETVSGFFNVDELETNATVPDFSTPPEKMPDRLPEKPAASLPAVKNPPGVPAGSTHQQGSIATHSRSISHLDYDKDFNFSPRRSRSGLWLTAALALLVIVGAGLYGEFGRRLLDRPMSTRIEERPSEVVKEEPQQAPAAPPLPAPAPTVIQQQAQQQTPPQVSAAPPRVEPAKIVKAAPGPALPSAPAPVARATKAPPAPRPKKVAKKQRDAESNERKIAAQAPVKSFAYLTVLSDPDAQIFIDGKSVGIEVANNIRVPAEKKIVVKVVPKGSSGASKVQTLQFKAYSRNVIEVSAK